MITKKEITHKKSVKIYTYEEATAKSLEYFNGDELAANVFLGKYALKDKKDNLIESNPEDMHRRIAKEFARIEKRKFKKPITEESIFSYLDRFKYIVPQGSPMFGIGNDYQIVSISNCYVTTSPYDSYVSIISTDNEMAQISKRRGGVGADLDKIRPLNSPVSNAARSSTGVTPFMKRYSNTIREVGQCIAKGEKVLTEKGLQPIEQIKIGDKVWTRKGFVEVIKTLSNGKKKIFKVTTSSGFDIKASDSHIFIDNNNNEKHLKDFEIGDNIVLIPGCSTNKECINLNIENYETNGKNNSSILNTSVALPKTLNEDLAYFLGFSYGDGSVDFDSFNEPYVLGISCEIHEEKSIEKLSKIIKEQFDYDVSISSVDGDRVNVEIFSKIILKYLSDNKILKGKSKNLIFPQHIIDSPSSVQMAFFSGYFDADGCSQKSRKVYKSSSIDLLFSKTLQKILFANGIGSKIHTQLKEIEDWSPIYTLSIVGKTFQNLLKEKACQSIKISSSNWDLIRDCFLTPYDHESVSSSHNNFNYITTSDQKLSLSSYRKLVLENDYQELPNISIIDEIVSIEEVGFEETYDLSLLKEHLFWCEGFLVHNSGRRGALMLTISIHHPESVVLLDTEKEAKEIIIPGDKQSNTRDIHTTSEFYNPNVADFCTVKFDRNQITGANISIKLTDEFMEAVKNGTTYEQRWPVDAREKGQEPAISKQVDARRVWRKIIHAAWQMAEPGLLMWDLVRTWNAIDCYKDYGFETTCTNPCCFSKESEVFVITKNGIKEIKKIDKNDLIWIDSEKDWAKTSGYFNAGQSECFKVKFSNGSEIEATGNHKLLKIKSIRDKTKTIYIADSLCKIEDLRIGDKVSAHISPVTDFNWGSKGSYDEGLILGWLTGDGCLSYYDDKLSSANLGFWQYEHDAWVKIHESFVNLGYDISLINNSIYLNNTMSLISRKFTEVYTNKYQNNISKFKSENLINEDIINEDIFDFSKDFIIGYLQSYFSADGTVHCDTENSSYNIQLVSIDKERLNQIRNFLLLFGIKSSISLMREAGKSCFGDKCYATKDCYRVTITGNKNIKIFTEQIGFISKVKHNKLLNILDNFDPEYEAKQSNYTEIVSIESVGSKEVGCIEVDQYHTFTANGIISGNSELPLCEHDSCRLLVQNLYSYVVNPFTKDAYFDYDLFKEHAGIAQRLMDDMIDLEIEKIDQIINKIESDPEPEKIKRFEKELWISIREKCVNGRRTGTGVTATADTLAALGIKYGSEESIKTVDNIHRIQKLECFRSSVEMSKEIGSFPIWNWEIEKDSLFLKQIEKEDKDLYDSIKNNGRRNIGLLTVAPTGSVSILTQTTSGVEPLFKLDPYIRNKKINPNDKNARIDFVDQSGDSWQRFPVYHPKVADWMKITGESDLSKSPWFGSTANDLDWKQRVRVQSSIQVHIDHAISSTINLPENVSEKNVAEIYETAWQHKCKGMTVYRDGCRSGVLVSKSDIKDKKENIQKTNAPKRSKDVNCDIHHTKSRGEDFFVIVGLLEGHPYEVFAGKNVIVTNSKKGILTKNKRGHYKLKTEDGFFIENVCDLLTDEQAVITRMISLSLRHGSDISFIVDQLEKSPGDMTNFGKAMARVLKKYINDGDKVSGSDCPECSNSQIVREAGCKTCKNCGWSACS